jgi:hypothetical protein
MVKRLELDAVQSPLSLLSPYAFIACIWTTFTFYRRPPIYVQYLKHSATLRLRACCSCTADKLWFDSGQRQQFLFTPKHPDLFRARPAPCSIGTGGPCLCSRATSLSRSSPRSSAGSQTEYSCTSSLSHACVYWSYSFTYLLNALTISQVSFTHIKRWFALC